MAGERFDGGSHGEENNERQEMAERQLLDKENSPFSDIYEVRGAGEAGAIPTGEDLDLKQN